MATTQKYSDLLGEWLKNAGYTHYFYVGGGNIMHLTESLDKFLHGIPVVHEVAAGIAAEYFNLTSQTGKALALVTAGPGITNIVTAISAAWLESRELLVIGGQVKTTDLSRGEVRGRGIQEIDGQALVSSVTKASVRLDKPIIFEDFYRLLELSWTPRKGPVFIEIPIDIQASYTNNSYLEPKHKSSVIEVAPDDVEKIAFKINKSKKPVILLGGGIDYKKFISLRQKLISKKVPIMTTYNGADLIDGDDEVYVGRPNTWGQRSANILIQKSDLIICVGTRLGLQQTGFNWQEFGRDAEIIQIDIDKAELTKGHPHISSGLSVDATDFLEKIVNFNLGNHRGWLDYCIWVRGKIPRVEDINNTGDEFISPYEFILDVEKVTTSEDLIIPCSSGSAFTLTMQLFKQKLGQRIITNKSLASMGYGLSGAIGACLGARNSRRTILIEGDGGFAQNLQELGTVSINKLNLKMFIFDDMGHASIRMTQRSYFNGRYLGCDEKSGLGLPKWDNLFQAWGINSLRINRGFTDSKEFRALFDSPDTAAFIVTIDPEQTYFPKISSAITENGGMVSNPLDKMSPEVEYLK